MVLRLSDRPPLPRSLLLELQRQLPKSQVLLSFFFTPIVSVHSKIASVAIGFLLYHEHSQAKVVVLGGHFHFSSILVGVFLWIPNWRKRKLGCPSCHWYQNLRWLGLREPIPSWWYSSWSVQTQRNTRSAFTFNFLGVHHLFLRRFQAQEGFRDEGQGRGLLEVQLPSPPTSFPTLCTILIIQRLPPSYVGFLDTARRDKGWSSLRLSQLIKRLIQICSFSLCRSASLSVPGKCSYLSLFHSNKIPPLKHRSRSGSSSYVHITLPSDTTGARSKKTDRAFSFG